MVYLTTTKLAVRLNLDRKNLFAKLNEWGWLEREKDRWVLTDLGRKHGGQIRSTPDIGEFVVWPENISIVLEETPNESEDRYWVLTNLIGSKHLPLIVV